MHIRIGIPLLLLLYTLTACGNNLKAPNEANFRAAINAELAKKNPYCREILRAEITGHIEPSPLATTLGKHRFLDPFGPRGWWNVSPEGKKLAPSGSPPSTSLEACTADGAEVAKIDNWTEPASMFGTTVTEVSYTYKPTKVAAWITPDIVPLIPNLNKEVSRKITLTLTAKGWEKAT